MNNKKEIIDLMLDKLNKESDMSWKEIVSYLGLPWSDSHCRKVGYGVKLYNDYLHEQGIENATDEQLVELNEKIMELKKERTKNQDLRTYINRQLRNEARFERMLEYAKEIAELKTDSPLLSTYDVKNKYNSEKEGILMLSDWHCGLTAYNNWNRFDKEILIKRVNYLKDETIRICKEQKVDKINILILSDLINGLIHTTTRIENNENVIEQCITVSDILTELIHDVSNHFEIDVYTSLDNHSRVVANIKDSLQDENFAILIEHIVKHRCSSLKNVEFKENKIDRPLIAFDCLGYKVVGCHGDIYVNKNNAIQNMINLLGYVPDLVLTAHLHHLYVNTNNKTEHIINGSLSGTDTYAKSKALISRCSQNLLIMKKGIGKECMYNIYLSHII